LDGQKNGVFRSFLLDGDIATDMEMFGHRQSYFNNKSDQVQLIFKIKL